MSETSYEAHLRQADLSVIGIAFIGTPHRGAGLAPYVTCVGNILKTFRIQVNKNVVEVLKHESEVLADVEDSFAIWLRKKGDRLKVTYFYEELGVSGIGQVWFRLNMCPYGGIKQCLTNGASILCHFMK